MNTKIAIEMVESLLTDNETGTATLGQNGDEVAIALYTELARKESQFWQVGVVKRSLVSRLLALCKRRILWLIGI